MSSFILSKTFFFPFKMLFLPQCDFKYPRGYKEFEKHRLSGVRISHPAASGGNRASSLEMDRPGIPHAGNHRPMPYKTFLIWVLGPVSSSLGTEWGSSDITRSNCQTHVWPLTLADPPSLHTPLASESCVTANGPSLWLFPPGAGWCPSSHSYSRIPVSVLLRTQLAIPPSTAKHLCVWGWIGGGDGRRGFGTKMTTPG